ncbi:zinc finger and BTB domain-containing protein 17 [Coccinella septempunctata]|uniref:zinc finger and BTB domain-containing protein 17 n=1 Tax=Coccinella septempunctata TaxID=41139 RepID=UPI001D05F0E2|nr:zinc finger and BTB domain-containing protein 17 [Coccinella septempunctata]XP_044761110.1 zinc finger and BTB domain-containing protein 17 [Coccinella septempunctata]
MESSPVCPVCTLYLRPGITLKSHLSTHPKQKVIEALVKLTEVESQPGENNTGQELCQSSQNQPFNSITNSPWTGGNIPGSSQIQTPFQGNHVFIYQQSMSTSQTNTINPLAQQYIIPAVLNPQTMPYVYQQQQVIMSSGSCLPQMRIAPFDLNGAPGIDPLTTVIEPPRINEEDDLVNVDEARENVEVQELDNNSELSIKDDEMEEVEEEEHRISGKETEVESKVQEDCCDLTFVDSKLDGSLRMEEEGEEEEEVVSENWESTPDELNKACQTSSTSGQQVDSFGKKTYYYDNESGNAMTYETAVPMEPSYEQQDPIYTSANILQSTEEIDFEVDGVPVIIGEFANSSVISQVDNFENINEGNVLMTIGENGLDNGVKETFGAALDNEESMSRGSTQVNIQADERMPPRGELSGQESLGGASDINWNRLHYNEVSSSASYDHLGREGWEDSDVDCPGNEEENDVPSVIGYTPPALNFKCSSCEEAFSCLQERKKHIQEKHSNQEQKQNTNIIGSLIGKKKVKKLTIKPKSEEPKFDTVFTNKIKLEKTECKAEVDDVKTDETDSRTVCDLCNSVQVDQKALRDHRIKVHKIPDKARLKCSTCDELFANEYKFTEHLKVHPLECKMCGKLFYRRQNIQLHMKRHLGIKPYKCDVCEKAFLTKQKLDEHRNVHTGNAPIKCPMCNETFRRHSNLIQHRYRHHLKHKRKLKDYVCHCGEYFHSRKKLAWHKETHDTKPKACTKCSEKFVHMSSLTRHMRKAHNERFLPSEERSNENVECPVCKGVFVKSSLEVHMRTHTGAKPYSCLICNKDFSTRWNLKLHKWTHASRVSKPFKCDQCNGAFVRESDYISHMNSHKSIKPYTCNYCGARFIRKYNCQRHVKEHENVKTFSCSICGKMFHRSYYLKDHMRVHSGVRPYTCHICGKTSTTKSNHNKHVQIHHPRSPVTTEN